MNTTHTALLSAGLLALGLAACTAGEANTTSDSSVAADVAAAVSGDAPANALEAFGPWMAESTGGSHVTLSVATDRLAVGPQSVEISVHSPDGAAAPYSVDLVSPSMPMHGVVRYPVAEGQVELTIPMEGDWAVYVNLDGTGDDTAEFVFQVAPDGEGGHQHGGAAPATHNH